MNRQAIYETLKIDEGVVYEIYLDHLNYATFGVGHLIKESDGRFSEVPNRIRQSCHEVLH